MTLHDACGARGDHALQQAVRKILHGLGCEVTESELSGDKTPCCGYGGLVSCANPKMAKEFAQSIAQSAQGLPVVSYCMACRDRIAREGVKSLHLLELLYGADAGSPPGLSEKRRNRLKLKERLLKEKWGGRFAKRALGFGLTLTEEARALMEERMILDTDVIAVMQHYHDTGRSRGGLGQRPARHADAPGQRHLLGKIHRGRAGLYGAPRVQPPNDGRNEVTHMAGEQKTYYTIDPEGRLKCRKCGVPLVKANAVFGYLDNAFPVELPVCPGVRVRIRAGRAGHGQGAFGGKSAGRQVKNARAGCAVCALRGRKREPWTVTPAAASSQSACFRFRRLRPAAWSTWARARAKAWSFCGAWAARPWA